MKKVKIEFDWWEADVLIEDTPETLEKMKEQLLFWMGGQQWIDDEDGDVEMAYLKMLTRTILPLSMDYNLFGIVEKISDREGWYPIDGTHGVKLISCDSWYFESGNIHISTVGSPK